MRISVIAWGSLVWDRRELAIADHFKPNGPRLSLEFSRVSTDRRLTLVIDEEHGSPCDTYSAQSAMFELSDAIENLRAREDTPIVANIGFVDLTTGEKGARAIRRHPGAVSAIEAWTKANGYDAAIWTALASNFHDSDRAGEPFDVEAAIRLSRQ